MDDYKRKGKANMKKVILQIQGMTCRACEQRIYQALMNVNGVTAVKVNYSTAMAEVEFDDNTTERDLISAIEKTGYGAKPTDHAKQKTDRFMPLVRFIIITLLVYSLLGKIANWNTIPQIDKSLDIGLLFLIGILTSVHCVAMCGGIVISQTGGRISLHESPWKSRIWPSFSYNFGRIMAYTIIGALAGALGSLVTFTGTARGIVTILSGILMLIVGLNMIDLFAPLRKIAAALPSWHKLDFFRSRTNQTPFYVGLANGLMPCGPLQAMQIYALATGSFWLGAKAMLFFGLGTVPLVFAFGVLNSFLSRKYARGMLKASAVLVTAMGLVMISRGLALSGKTLLPAGTSAVVQAATAVPAKIVDNRQIVRTIVDDNGYTTPPTILKKGVPVKWVIEAKSLNGCNNPINIPELSIEKTLTAGQNVIEFTPQKSGNLIFSCWMGMITGYFHVADNPSQIDPKDLAVPSGTGGSGMPCCK